MKKTGAVLVAAFVFVSCIKTNDASSADLRYGSHHHIGYPVTELYINKPPHIGRLYQYAGSSLARRSLSSNSYSALYVIQVVPGQSYSLGFSYPSKARTAKFSVNLFDRWPHLLDAHRISLPMGPTVRTNLKKVSYRWQVGISPRSTGSFLYVLVEASEPYRKVGFPKYRIFMISPPVHSSSNMASGVTFLQGPESLLLAEERKEVVYTVKQSQLFSEKQIFPAQLPGDIIKNGRFNNGLNYWKPHINYDTAHVDKVFFSLSDQGLRIWSDLSAQRMGILQTLNIDVSEAESLILWMDVKVTKQVLAGTGPDGNDGPVAVAICYRDVLKVKHCGDSAYRRVFYYLDPVAKQSVMNGKKVAKDMWYRFEADLVALKPRPAYLNYISLEGLGWPTREGWVREVHLIRK